MAMKLTTLIKMIMFGLVVNAIVYFITKNL